MEKIKTNLPYILVGTVVSVAGFYVLYKLFQTSGKSIETETNSEMTGFID